MKKEKGWTLIECLISMTLSILLLTILHSIFFHLEKDREVQSNWNRDSENIRDANYFLQVGIRSAGFMGCGKMSDDFPIINHTKFKWTASNSVEKNKISEMKSGTEAITVRYVEPYFSMVKEEMHNANEIIVDSKINFDKNDIVFISDCKNLEITSIQSISKESIDTQRLTFANSLNTLFKTNAWIARVKFDTFYIGLDNALYIKDINAHHKKLIDNINDLPHDF